MDSRLCGLSAKEAAIIGANGLRVRDAEPTDTECIARIADASWRATYGGVLPPQAIESRLEREYGDDVLARRVAAAAASEYDHFLVAVRDPIVVGFADYGLGARGPELFALYADPAAYGSGVGTALLAALHGRLAGKVDGYVVDVHSRNWRGRAFYARSGFYSLGRAASPDCDVTLYRSLGPTT
jgi:GNAT superfamily N-acetyltransferase